MVSSVMKISIIVPTYNEAQNIGGLVKYLAEHGTGYLHEVIVTDGGSGDNTFSIAIEAGAKAVYAPLKGRASQMNYGASLAEAEILYFVHADTLPPKTYAHDIIQAIREGYSIGRYLSAYQSTSLLLKINAFLSRFDTFEGMGGDQTLFITKSLFEKVGGFNNEMQIMEEFEFCARARIGQQYKIIPKPALISARKYNNNSWAKVQFANYTIVKMYKSGASQESMIKKYKELLS